MVLQVLGLIFLTCNATNTVNDIVNQLLANRVVATSIFILVSVDEPKLFPQCHVQLLAASSLPLMRSSGWKR